MFAAAGTAAGGIWTESTAKYQPFIGGSGIGWKVLWDECPLGTAAFDAASPVIFGVGPLNGTGTPSSGRTAIACLWPNAYPEAPAAGHMGGHWGPELKYAGYDSLVVVGQAAQPVWLQIEDGMVTVQDASPIWGEGIYRSTNWICNQMGTEAHVACIGPAGENQGRLAAVFCDRSHSAGGAGGVLGSKYLKAVGVKGTGSVTLGTDKTTWKNLQKYHLALLGSNYQGTVHKYLQPWSPYSPSGSRWSGMPGALWGSSTPPVDLGYCADAEHPYPRDPHPLNKIGARTHKGWNDFGFEGMRRTVKMDGCHACPIRCHIAASHPELNAYGITQFNMNTCSGNGGISGTIANASSPQYPDANVNSNNMLLTYMCNNLADDIGMFNDYSGTLDFFKLVLNQPITGLMIDNVYSDPWNATPGVGKLPNGNTNAAPVYDMYGNQYLDTTVTPNVPFNPYVTPWKLNPAVLGTANFVLPTGVTQHPALGGYSAAPYTFIQKYVTPPLTYTQSGSSWVAPNGQTYASGNAGFGAPWLGPNGFVPQPFNAKVSITATAAKPYTFPGPDQTVITASTTILAAGEWYRLSGTAWQSNSTGPLTTLPTVPASYPKNISGWAGVVNTFYSVKNTTGTPLNMLWAGDPRWVQFMHWDCAMNVPGTIGFLYLQGSQHLMSLMPEVGLWQMWSGTSGGANTLHQGQGVAPIWPVTMANFGGSALATCTTPTAAGGGRNGMSHHNCEQRGYVGAMLNAIASIRDPNTHSWETFNSGGLPNTGPCPVQQQIAQEIVTNPNGYLGQQVTDQSVAQVATGTSPGWGWDVTNVIATPTPMNLARAAVTCDSMLIYELHNSIGQCNYTSPVKSSPIQSRNYRGDVSLEAQNFSAATMGSPAYIGTGTMGKTSQAELEFMALRNFTVLRALHAAHFTYWSKPRTFTSGTYAGCSFPALTGSGADMRHNFDGLSAWNFNPGTQGNAIWNPSGAPVVTGTLLAPVTAAKLSPGGVPLLIPATIQDGASMVAGSSSLNCDYSEFDMAKSMCYQLLGWDYNGLPSVEMLTKLGLAGSGSFVTNDIATTLAGMGITLSATIVAATASITTPPATTIGGAYPAAFSAWGFKAPAIPTTV